MAGDWIKIQHVTPDKPEVWQIAEITGLDADAVVGKLLRIWIWADQQTVDGNARSVTFALLNRISGVTGFAEAMVEVGWLLKEGMMVRFQNFDRHNGKTAKNRALGANRQESRRGRRDSVTQAALQKRDISVTKALPEKRREEIEKTHTPGESQKPQTPERCPHEQGQQEVTIPEKMRTPECARAFEDWCDYLDAAGLDTVNPRYNYQQAQAVWRQANRIGPDKWPACVEFSIANGYKSIIQKTEPPGATGGNRKAQPETDGDFIRAVQVCREFPSGSDYDRQKREEILGEKVMKIVRQVKSSRLADVNEFNHRAMAEEWRLTKEGMK